MTITCLQCKALEVDLVVEKGGRGSSVSENLAFLCLANTFSVLRVRWGDLKGVGASIR